jgi:hypothetical protein
MTERYSHLAPDNLVAAVEKVVGDRKAAGGKSAGAGAG